MAGKHSGRQAFCRPLRRCATAASILLLLFAAAPSFALASSDVDDGPSVDVTRLAKRERREHSAGRQAERTFLEQLRSTRMSMAEDLRIPIAQFDQQVDLLYEGYVLCVLVENDVRNWEQIKATAVSVGRTNGTADDRLAVIRSAKRHLC